MAIQLPLSSHRRANAQRPRHVAARVLAAVATTLTLLLGAAGLSRPASAQQRVCLPHDAAVEKLQGQFDERVSARGLANEGRAMVELFRSDTGSWTLIMTDVRGRSCVMATGEAWHDETLKGEVSS